MKKIRFTIRGNQENSYGNPIPYLRTTQNSQWTDKAQRYQAWKGHVVANFIDCIQAMPKEERAEFADVINLADKKPIKKSKNKIAVIATFVFKDDTHADCDNIFKGIADALFMNDKYVIGSFDFSYGPRGMSEIEIIFI